MVIGESRSGVEFLIIGFGEMALGDLELLSVFEEGNIVDHLVPDALGF